MARIDIHNLYRRSSRSLLSAQRTTLSLTASQSEAARLAGESSMWKIPTTANSCTSGTSSPGHTCKTSSRRLPRSTTKPSGRSSCWLSRRVSTHALRPILLSSERVLPWFSVLRLLYCNLDCLIPYITLPLFRDTWAGCLVSLLISGTF